MAHIELQNVSRAFGKGKERVLAVDSVSLAIERGEIRCLVGESGCGKSTTGKIMAGLLKATGGQVLYDNKPIDRLSAEEYREYRHAVQIIHQDPYASLNPVQTIQQIITTPLLHHRKVNGAQEAYRRAIELLEIVDLTPAIDFMNKYPHQLSGGQRQRVSVARALTVDPKFIVADEAVSMVDVSIRVSLLNMLMRLKDEFDVTFLFITHDLALAKYFAWQGAISVMYLGRVVEEGPTPRCNRRPAPPVYTGFAGGCARGRPGADAPQAPDRTAQRRYSEFARPAARLHLPPALPLFRGGRV